MTDETRRQRGERLVADFHRFGEQLRKSREQDDPPMTADIVRRLRATSHDVTEDGWVVEVMLEAADEIERLQIIIEACRASMHRCAHHPDLLDMLKRHGPS